MNESITINENNKDMFNINIPSFDTGGAVPPPPVSSAVQTSEFESFTEKSLVSFSTMAICIVIFLIIVFIIKKRNSSAINTEREYKQEQNIENDNDYIHQPIIQNKRKSYLSTPSSIHKCIKSFLENTKEN